MPAMTPALSVVLAGASIAALASQPTLRETLVATLMRWTGFGAPGGVWRIAALLLALANLKNLPFVWHLRVLGAIVYHTYLQPTPIPPHALFQPAVTSSRAPLLETDYNLHKSNSTYFSDMDASRSHLFTAVIRNAIRKDSAAKKEGSRHIVALGGISCLFKKEIKPYAKYEMWSRVLCWDRKWFYLITHLVKPGVGKPASWTLQPWRKTKSGADQDVDKDKLMGAVYATAIAKYVIKKGRLTISPEQALRDADMVPAKPDGWVYHGEVNGNANGDILPDTVKADEWTWDIIEKERLRGLAVAQKFADMEGLHESFDGGREGALGEFSDLIF